MTSAAKSSHTRTPAARNGALEHIKEVFPGPCSRDSHVGCSALSLCPECGAKADVYERGPVGENIVHIASLTNTPQVGAQFT